MPQKFLLLSQRDEGGRSLVLFCCLILSAPNPTCSFRQLTHSHNFQLIVWCAFLGRLAFASFYLFPLSVLVFFHLFSCSFLGLEDNPVGFWITFFLLCITGVLFSTRHILELVSRVKLKYLIDLAPFVSLNEASATVLSISTSVAKFIVPV
jgi:hypothetical protein